MKRSLIVDGQILQTGAWHRGMGKYILQVLDELSRNFSQKTNIALLLNDRLPCDESRFETLQYLYPNIEIVHGNLPIPDKTQRKGEQRYKKQLNLCIDEHFPDTENFYLLTSLFLFDFYAEFPDNCHKLAMFYDLTPLLFWKDLGGYFPEGLYMERFSQLYDAEHIFAISETTRQDLLTTLGLNPERVTNINGGFTKIADKPNRPKGFTIPDKFILFPTGSLPHKNNQVTVKAFEQYCLKHKSNRKLLITSHFDDQVKRQLLALSKHIIFTENVSDNELEWLYENAEAVIFSSKYEGLGMPILDAIANKKPVIASQIPVFEEMSKRAFYFFDPESVDELESQIEQALSGDNFKSKLQHYPAIMDKYTWANTTQQLHSYVEHPIPNKVSDNRKVKPRIAVCSIHPGINDQIGRLSEQLYFSLRDNFQVEYYFDSNGQNFREIDRPTFLDSMDCKVFDISALGLTTYPKYAAVVYLLDAYAIPSRVAQRAVVLPGIVVSGNFSELDRQGKLLKQLILANPDYNYVYNAKGFKEYQDIVSCILSKVTHLREHPSPSVSILKKGGSKRSMINQLKKVHEHDS